MSFNVLQKNLQDLIKKNNYQIADLERKAGLKKNNIYNIIKGISKKPSAELLQAVSDVLGVTVKDLYNTSTYKYPFMTVDDLDLLVKTAEEVVKEIKNQTLELSCSTVTSIITEVFNYSIEAQLQAPDLQFVKWILNQKYSK